MRSLVEDLLRERDPNAREHARLRLEEAWHDEIARRVRLESERVRQEYAADVARLREEAREERRLRFEYEQEAQRARDEAETEHERRVQLLRDECAREVTRLREKQARLREEAQLQQRLRVEFQRELEQQRRLRIEWERQAEEFRRQLHWMDVPGVAELRLHRGHPMQT